MGIEIEEIKKINLSDGDILILQVDQKLTGEQRDSMYNSLASMFQRNKCLILDKGISIGVLTKEDIEGM